MSRSRRKLGGGKGEVIVIRAWRITKRQSVRGWGAGCRSRMSGRGRMRRRRTVEDEVLCCQAILLYSPETALSNVEEAH